MDINVELLDPNGDPLPVESVTVTETVNQGWTWSATLAKVPHTYTVGGVGGKSLLDAFLEDAIFTLTLTVDGVSVTLPPLVVQDYQESAAGGGTIGGIDLVTYRLTRSTHIIPATFALTAESWQVINWMAGEIAMTGKLGHFVSWSFPLRHFGSGERTSFLPQLQRLLDIAGYEFRCTRVSDAEYLDFYPLEIAPSGEAGVQPDWSSVARARSFSDRVTRFVMLKTSPMDSAPITPETLPANYVGKFLPGPYHSIQASSDRVTLWDGHPSAGGVQRGSGGLSFGEGQVTHYRSEVNQPVPVIFNGTRLAHATGVDLAFELSHDSGISPPRPADDPWEEPLVPTLAHAQALAETYLWRMNRGTHTMSWEGPPCLWLGLGYRLTWPGFPDSRVESVTHTVGGGQASTSAVSAALGAAQW